MENNQKYNNRSSYIQKISALNKTPEEVARIEKLFHENENIAYNIAKKYYKTGFWEFDDSIQIARMGLWKACLIWDPNKFKLSTLATNVITRDFIDYDTKQKKQPRILFNLEENCVTDDLNLGDVLVDEKSVTHEIIEGDDSVKYINKQVLNILEDIALELQIPSSQVKTVYLIYIESSQYSEVNVRSIKFLPRNTVNNILMLLKQNLSKIMEED